MIKDLEYYLSLEYDIVVRKLSIEDGGGYFAYYKDIQGVMGDGESKEEAIKDVKLAFRAYLLNQLELSKEIIEPLNSKRLLREIDRYIKNNHLSKEEFLNFLNSTISLKRHLIVK